MSKEQKIEKLVITDRVEIDTLSSNVQAHLKKIKNQKNKHNEDEDVLIPENLGDVTGLDLIEEGSDKEGWIKKN